MRDELELEQVGKQRGRHVTDAEGNRPGVTVVIPVKGRLPLLECLLDSLSLSWAQDEAPSGEVLVVWDGSDDPQELVERFAETCGVRARCLYKLAGPASKRNLGIESAGYDLTLFVDSDCTIHPKLLATVSQAFTDQQIHSLAVPVVFTDPASALEVAVAAMPYRQAFAWPGYSVQLWWAPTATFALRRATVARFGDFLPASRGADQGQDVDLGLRWTHRLGRPAVIAIPSCPTRHSRETWAGAWPVFERSWRFGTTEGALWPRHPSFRRRNLPPFAAAGVLLLLGGSAASVLDWGGRYNSDPRPLVILGCSLLLGWLMSSVAQFRKSRVGLMAIPVALLLIFVFDLARTWSLWRARTLTGGIWFHQRQAAGTWWVLALNGWILLGVGLLMWLVTGL